MTLNLKQGPEELETNDATPTINPNSFAFTMASEPGKNKVASLQA
jgi:hypothetical protein